jgi:16S rRNA (cytosine1407-C5)-methyltransferase
MPEIFSWTIRTNTIKITSKELEERFGEKGWKIEKIPWFNDGFFVECDQLLSKTAEHSLGYFFIQDASSMVPPSILDPSEDETILDLCASPGAKTTEIAAMMNNTGAIVANDIDYTRLKALRGNLQRCGVLNTVVIKGFAENFYKTGLKFKKILLDVPCTATGTMNPRILKQTKEEGIKKLSNLQKRIITSTIKSLEEDGIIVYSTCSLEKEENEEVVDYAVKELGLKTEKIEIKGLPTQKPFFEEYDEEVKNAIRIPFSERSEGFFVCKLRL